MSERFPIKQQSNKVNDSPGRLITHVKPVALTCHEYYMEIAIKADLFELGLPVDASELRLGPDSQLIPACKVMAFSSNQFIIAAELTDCGTQHWITDDSVVYTNLLIFSPQPSPDGVIQLENAVVPRECHYSRCLMDEKLTGSTSRFLPRIQNDKLQIQLDAFKFQQEKRTEMYIIYITCSLQVYPVMNDVNPVHKACSFIDGSWCSADGDDWACYSCQKQKNYAPSFRFKQEQFGPPAASITDQTSSTHRLSKFQPRIQNSSGSSLNVLQTPCEPVPPSWRRIIDPQEEESGSVGWEQEKTLGPLAIFPKKAEMGFLAPPRVKEGVPHFPSPSKDKKPMPHSSLWKNGVTEEMDTEGDVTSLPTLEPTELPNITASEPEEELEEEEDNSNYYEEEKGEAREAIKDMWKTKVLPENDLEELFTIPASTTDEDYGVTALSTSSSLLDEVEQTSTHHPLKGSLVTNLWKAMDADKDEMDPTVVEDSLVLITQAEINA